MSVSHLHLRATVSSRSDVTKFVSKPGDAVLIDRGGPRWLILSCPCGCGEHFPINLNSRTGPAWSLYDTPQGQLSVFPSVWRESGCQSHYIIWRGKIYLFGKSVDRDEGDLPEINLSALEPSIRGRLSPSTWRHFTDVASDLDAVPWDVLEVCRKFVKRGEAAEGTGKQRGHFRLIKPRNLVNKSV